MEQFIEVLVMIGQLVLALSILVGVHEMGHMLSAKYFGMKVEKFSIGFPPKLFGFKKGETEYSVGAIPLGGFVKISGMIDESLDSKSMAAEPQPWEFRSKPAWQRLIVMLGGIIVNVFTAFIIFIALSWILGEEYKKMDDVNKHGIVAQELAKKIGLQTGDKIIAVNGKKIDDFHSVYEVVLEDNMSYTIIRNGEEKIIQIPNDMLDKLSDKDSEGFIDMFVGYKVGGVLKGSNAEKGGLKAGDSIIQINGKDAPYYHVLKEELSLHKSQPVDITVIRDKSEKHLSVQVDTAGLIGFQAERIHLTPVSIRKFSLLQSIPHGIQLSFKVITDQFKAFAKIFKGELKASNSVGSFITIATAFGPKWDWVRFWTLVGTLSMVLAFMNLLPIPALDGGHVMFLLYEIVSGRKPSDSFLETAQKIGMAILLCLMVFAISNDVIRNFF